MGFDLKRDVSKTEFQYPGVMNFARTCLHALLSLLDSVISTVMESPPPDLVESGYHLLYLLAANYKTSGPVLRFLRLNKSFFKNHLKESRKNFDKGKKTSPKIYRFVNRSHVELTGVNQLSWLMKTLAIELKVTSNIKQVTYLKQLTSFLINIPAGEEGQEDIFSLVQKNLLETRIITPDDVKLNNFMTSFVDYFEFKVPAVDTPNWEFFDNNALNQILQQCQKKSTMKLIDLKKLHQILYDELKNLQGNECIEISIRKIFLILLLLC